MTLVKERQKPKLDYRLLESDADAIEKMAKDTGVFNAEEVAVARELAIDTLSGKDDSYNFLFLRDEQGIPLAYTCYGLIPFTDNRYDLYWIIVSPSAQGMGLGKQIMDATEKHVAELGGRHLYAETSGTDKYIPARKFYLKNGFSQAAVLKDFYRDGDDKVIYCMKLV